MTLRRSRAVTFRPTTACDSLDTTNGPVGGMKALSNLVPNPSTDRTFVPRPAAVKLTSFSSFTDPIFISGLLIVGDVAYGMISSARFTGKDEPFAYNIKTNTFLTILGCTAGNTPASPANQGDWTPPILCQVGTRIIVTHPGFSGGNNPFFGWLDMGSLNATVTANTTSGSPTITGNPSIVGVQPGLILAGGGIPVGTTVKGTANVVVNTSGTTHSNTTLDGLGTTTGVAVGQLVAGSGIVVGTTVASVDSPTQVTLSQAAVASATVAVTFTGTTITMSANATGSNSQESITITGGTPTQPLWGAGNTNGNALAAVPNGVAQMAGSAHYLVNQANGTVGIQISDPLQPCQITNAGQAITFSNGIKCTAIGPLGVTNLLGSVVQSLIVFQGTSVLQQIEGAFSLNNLTSNALNVPTGTQSPLSLEPLGGGLAFMSPEGLRIISSTGQVSDPIGDHGQGITVPFINAINPSRICVAANADTLRVTVKNGAVLGQPVQEWHYDLTRKIWTGPHTFPFSQLATWNNTFVGVAAQQSTTAGTIWGQFTWGSVNWGVGVSNLAALWQSDVVPSSGSVYIENGAQLTWVAENALSPDNERAGMNAIIESTLMLTTPSDLGVTIQVIDDAGATLDQVSMAGIGGSSTLWGGFTWGSAPWGGTPIPIYQRQIPWHNPLVFKQAYISISGISDGRVVIGNQYHHVEFLDYILQRAS